MGKVVAPPRIDPWLVFLGILLFANRRVPFEFQSYEGSMPCWRSLSRQTAAAGGALGAGWPIEGVFVVSAAISQVFSTLPG